MSFIAVGVSPESSVAYSCHNSSVSFCLEQLVFSCLSLALTFLVVLGQLFCRVFLNLGLSDIFSLLNSDHVYLAGISQRCYSSHCLPLGGIQF